MKYLVFGLIASLMVITGCATDGNKTAVTVYDSSGKVVQETSKDAVMLQSAYKMADACNKAKNSQAQAMQLGIKTGDLAKLSPQAQQQYMQNLPMMYMADALKSATSKERDGCQDAIVAYYNHKNVEKEANTRLWSKGLGIAGFLGGAYVIGNTLEGILSSATAASSTSNTISGSRVNMDSGNNYHSPGGMANSSSSGTGLGTSNLFTRGTDGTVLGGNQPRGTTTNLDDQNGQIDFGSNSGENAPASIIEVPVEE